ncbi:MAG: hypothetical protein R2851_27460 [Caldilineaceae bacterium]
MSLLTTMSMIRIWQYSFWGKYAGSRTAIAPPLSAVIITVRSSSPRGAWSR